jgi:hypothetical protein
VKIIARIYAADGFCDALDDRLNDMGRNEDIEDTPQIEVAEQAFRDLYGAWADDDDTLRIEFDTEAGTVRVLRVELTDAPVTLAARSQEGGAL